MHCDNNNQHTAAAAAAAVTNSYMQYGISIKNNSSIY
jgi:hypothetical protein